MNQMHEIDYKVFGDAMQFVELELDLNEAAIAEAGGMMMHGRRHRDGNHLWRRLTTEQRLSRALMLVRAKRLLTGESLFMTAFQNRGAGKSASPSARRIPVKSSPHTLLKSVANSSRKRIPSSAPRRCERRHRFQQAHRRGFFGGEGFIMQRLQGDGWAFLNAGGNIYERQLTWASCPRGHRLHVAFEPTGGFPTSNTSAKSKSALFGGEGLFQSCAGRKIWLQSLPAQPHGGSDRFRIAGGREASRKVPVLGGLGGLLDGDN